MRSMWKGAISFGLVMIPVKLYAATEQRDVTFRQVHREDGGRIKFRRFCSIDGEEVPFADVAKGYELPDGEMVVLTDDDLAELPLPTAHSIEVVNFAPAEQLDSILANRAYYTEPEPAGVRAYALLRDALERSGKVAIARVALRQRESLASLRTRDGVMVLETLLWPDEIRAADFDFLDEDVEVRSQELKMASSLIDVPRRLPRRAGRARGGEGAGPRGGPATAQGGRGRRQPGGRPEGQPGGSQGRLRGHRRKRQAPDPGQGERLTRGTTLSAGVSGLARGSVG
jgi:Ku protein